MLPAPHPLADVRADALALWELADVRTPFSHPDYVLAAADPLGLSPVALMSEGACVVGLEKRKGPVRALALPLASSYNAPILVARPREVDINQRDTPLDHLAQAVSGSFAQATLALPPNWPDARPFEWNGWSLRTRHTALVSLTENPSEAWSHGTRQPARRYEEAFDVREGAEEVAQAARAQVEAYDRRSLRLGLPAAALHRLGTAMRGLGLARAFGAYRDGACEAAALFAVDRSHATYWLSGSTPGPGMAVLFLHAMRALHEEGISTLDLGGANVPGVAQFKRQLGGVLTPVVVAKWVGPRWLRALHAFRS